MGVFRRMWALGNRSKLGREIDMSCASTCECALIVMSRGA
jgi:hypothetical protein